jgi:hypothetical protein
MMVPEGFVELLVMAERMVRTWRSMAMLRLQGAFLPAKNDHNATMRNVAPMHLAAFSFVPSPA